MLARPRPAGQTRDRGTSEGVRRRNVSGPPRVSKAAPGRPARALGRPTPTAVEARAEIYNFGRAHEFMNGLM
jgi:hypothetical protein